MSQLDASTVRREGGREGVWLLKDNTNVTARCVHSEERGREGGKGCGY